MKRLMIHLLCYLCWHMGAGTLWSQSGYLVPVSPDTLIPIPHSPLGSGSEYVRFQFVLSRDELRSAGFLAGSWQSISVNCSGVGTHPMALYLAPAVPGNDTLFQTMQANDLHYADSLQADSLGWSECLLSRTFVWDGQSGVCIQICISPVLQPGFLNMMGRTSTTASLRMSGNNSFSCETGFSGQRVFFQPAIRIHQIPTSPSASGLTLLPANGIYGVPPEGTRLQWADSRLGGEPTHYRVMLDTINPPLREIALVPASQNHLLTGNLIPGRPYFWKVIPENPGGSDTAGLVNYFITGSSYCLPTVWYSGGPRISEIVMNNQIYHSGSSCSTYNLHPDSLVLFAGDSLTLEVQKISCGGQVPWYLGLGIDRNGDGDFSDTSEWVLQTNQIHQSSHILRIGVPTVSCAGFTRMRIRIAENPITGNGCEAIGYGETEDFWLRVRPPHPPACVGSLQFTNGNQSVCPETPAFTLPPPLGLVHGYWVYRDRQFTLNHPDSFYYQVTQPVFRIPDTLQQSTNYYFQVIPMGPGGLASGCPIEQVFTLGASCSDTTCLPAIPHPSGLTQPHYASAVRFSWINPFGVLPDSVRISWDTVSTQPFRYNTGFQASAQEFTYIRFLPPGARIYWKPEFRERNGLNRNCPSIFSFRTTLIPAAPLYSVGNNLGDFISQVRLNNQDRLSGPVGTPGFYEQVDSAHFQIRAGAWHTLRLSAGTYPSGNRMAAWIDLNRNGRLEPAEKLGEIHVDAPAPAWDSIRFLVPACTDTGFTLLRIRETWGISQMDPVAEYPYGETEDYAVFIEAPEAHPPLCPVADRSRGTARFVRAHGDTLQWGIPLSGSCPGQFRISIGTDYPPGNHLFRHTLGVTTQFFTGPLSPNTDYYWKIEAENQNGISVSCPMDTLKVCALPVPAVISGFQGIGCDRATVTFQQPAGISQVQIQVAEDSLFQQLHPGYFATAVTAPDRSALTGLHTRDTWFVRLRSITPCDTGNWGPYAILNLIPDPDSVRLAQSGSSTCREIIFRWHSLPGITRYLVDVSTDSLFSTYLSGYNQRPVQQDTQLWVNGLRASRDYFIRVRASGMCGSGPFSRVLRITTLPDTWTGLDSIWHRPWNWCSGTIPDSLTDVVIIPGRPFPPSILQNAMCRNLEIQTGTSLRMRTTDTLTVTGIWAGGGIFHSGSGTVFFRSTRPQVFQGAQYFNRVVLHNPAGMSLEPNSWMHITGFFQPFLGYLHTNQRLVLELDSLRQSGILRGLSPMSGIAGPVRMRQVFSRTGGDRLLSTPFLNTNIGTWWSALGGNIDAYRYIESVYGPQSIGFQILADSTDTLENARGYYTTTRTGTVLELSGQIREGGYTFPLTWTVDPLNRSASGWNLVGNPYLCPINWDSPAGWQRTAVSNAVFYLDPLTRQQVSYINGVGTMGAGPVISPGQGFWVKSTGLSTHLSLDERVKVAQSGKFFRSDQPFAGYHVRLKEKDRMVSEAILRMESGTGIGVDAAWDAEYPGPLLPDFQPQIWLRFADTLDFTIQTVEAWEDGFSCSVCVEVPGPGKWNIELLATETNSEAPIHTELRLDPPDPEFRATSPGRYCPWRIMVNGRMENIRVPDSNRQVQVYPNPVVPGQDVHYALPKGVNLSESTLKVYDALGRHIAYFDQLQYEGTIPATIFPASGMYHLEFQISGHFVPLTLMVLHE